MKFFWFIATLFLIYGSMQIKAQTCGFGCLGLSGFYGGYTFQRYNADELNNFINGQILNTNRVNFEQTQGVRVGANLFRAKFENYFITAKAFFQFLKEKKSSNSLTLEGQTKQEFELKQDYWGIGFDFGIPITDFFDIKFVEAGINFYNIDLKQTTYVSNEKIDEIKYKAPEIKIGYYLGSGLIIHLIKDYVSLEGTAFYSFAEFKSLESADRNLDINSTTNLIENNRISGSVQLNLGFPL